MLPAAWAKEPAHPEISLNQAIAKALAHNEAVQKASKEVDRTETLRKEASSKLSFIPADASGDPALEIAWSNLLTADLTWQMSKKSLTAQEDTVALDTCKKYWDILVEQENVKAAQAALDSAQRQLQVARASYRVGIIPQSDLIAAEAGYRGAQAALSRAQNNLNSAYIAFNQMVGLWPEDRPVLTDNIEFHPLKIDNLDYEVEKVMENSPSVWLAQQKVTLQKYLEDMMFYTGQYRPYEARKIEVEQAKLDAASAKEMFDRITRSLYYSVISLEEAYAGAQEVVRMDEENLRVIKAKFDVGMATANDVAGAEKTLAEARANLVNLASQHAYAKLAFTKPWAVSAGSGAGSSGQGSPSSGTGGAYSASAGQ